ncbi:hypothetical protein D3C87_2074130 [compost metagenome]
MEEEEEMRPMQDEVVIESGLEQSSLAIVPNFHATVHADPLTVLSVPLAPRTISARRPEFSQHLEIVPTPPSM